MSKPIDASIFINSIIAAATNQADSTTLASASNAAINLFKDVINDDKMVNTNIALTAASSAMEAADEA